MAALSIPDLHVLGMAVKSCMDIVTVSSSWKSVAHAVAAEGAHWTVYSNIHASNMRRLWENAGQKFCL